MKKYFLTKSLLVCGFILLFNQACTNLDEEVFSELTAENFPTTEEQFISALGATYTSLYGFGAHNSFYSLNEIASDELLIPHRGADWFDGGQWLRVHKHEYRPNEESVRNGWLALYGGITNCNRVIDLFNKLVADGKVSEADAASFIAEVRVLRAYFYYWLLDMYGNVPIVDSFGGDAAPATRTRQEVYNFVESELKENVPLLTDAKDGTTYARFNRWAGKALLTRLYLNAEVYTGTAKYQEALDEATSIINSNLYSLENDYFANFNTENSTSNENIMVIPYDQSQAQGFNIAQMTLHYSSQATFNLQDQPWNGYCTLQEFYDSYDNADLRKGVPGNQQVRGNFHAGQQYAADGSTPLVDAGAEATDPDGQTLIFTPEINMLEPNCLRQAGARVGKYEYANGATPNLDNDFVLLRYANVILDAAEANWRLGNPAAALALVNQVRQRAGMPPFTAIDADGANLLAERGRELFFEGVRRADLIRFGKYGDPWTFKPASDATKRIFPIPSEQIATNPNLVQNPGY